MKKINTTPVKEASEEAISAAATKMIDAVNYYKNTGLKGSNVEADKSLTAAMEACNDYSALCYNAGKKAKESDIKFCFSFVKQYSSKK